MQSLDFTRSHCRGLTVWHISRPGIDICFQQESPCSRRHGLTTKHVSGLGCTSVLNGYTQGHAAAGRLYTTWDDLTLVLVRRHRFCLSPRKPRYTFGPACASVHLCILHGSRRLCIFDSKKLNHPPNDSRLERHHRSPSSAWVLEQQPRPFTGGQPQHDLCLSAPKTLWLGSPSCSFHENLSTQAKTSAGCRLTFAAGFAVSERRCAS